MDETIAETMVLRVCPDGSTKIEFFPVSFSEFIIDYVYDKEERDRIEQYGSRRIYCG